MLEGFIESKKGKIWYSVYGEDKEKTPLLVVHGGPGFLSMPGVNRDFSDERPVFFYDQLGCGKSDKAENPTDYSVEGYVEELDEVIKALGLSQVVLLGHSWGAALVCSYMLEKRPEGVKAIILSSPYLSSPMWDRDMKELISRMPKSFVEVVERADKEENYGEDYYGAMIEFYKKHMYTKSPFPGELMQVFGAINQDVYGMLWGPSDIKITGVLKDFDLYPRLGEIALPVLLICGDQDEMDVRTVRDYQMAFPDAKMAVVPDSGHMNHLEKPEIYKAVVRDFLK